MTVELNEGILSAEQEARLYTVAHVAEVLRTKVFADPQALDAMDVVNVSMYVITGTDPWEGMTPRPDDLVEVITRVDKILGELRQELAGDPDPLPA